MKAIRFHEFGGPDVLKLEEVPDPTLEPGAVLVDVHYSGVNPTDITTRSGRGNYPSDFSFPAMLGREASGYVSAIGSEVHSIQVGDRVVVRNTAYSYAEQLIAPESSIHVIPEGLETLAAATVVVTYTTAWDAIVNKAKVKAGQSVLIQGAAGGVGIAGVQIAKRLGATVLGTAGTGEKLDWLKAQGLDHGINYTAGPFAKQVKELSGGSGVDAIIDGVGGEPFIEAFNCLKPGGTVAIYGTAAGREVQFNLAQLFRLRASVMGCGGSGTSRQDFQEILELLASGSLTPTLDRTWPLAEAAAAQQYVEDRKVKGKVALTLR